MYRGRPGGPSLPQESLTSELLLETEPPEAIRGRERDLHYRRNWIGHGRPITEVGGGFKAEDAFSNAGIDLQANSAGDVIDRQEFGPSVARLQQHPVISHGNQGAIGNQLNIMQVF